MPRDFFHLYFGRSFRSAFVERRNLAVSPRLASLAGLTLLFLSDIHASAMFPEQSTDRLIEQIKSLNPDLICLGGDYAESADAQTRFFRRLSAVRPPLGSFAVMGNNDFEHFEQDGQKLTDLMRQSGVTPLVDSEASVTAGSCRVLLAGLNALNMRTHAEHPYFARSGENDFRIVLAHYPQSVRLASGEFAAAPHLGLSGHTHGGQFRLFGLTPYHIGFELPGKSYLMPAAGWTDKPGFPTLVSNGIGSSRVPFRLNVPPMMHLITLTCPPNSDALSNSSPAGT